jgi:hypothetical protein
LFEKGGGGMFGYYQGTLIYFMLYSNMSKSKSKSSYKKTFLYCNVLIFIGLLGLYCYLTRDVKEGVSNMNCCGGIEPGVHYSETDTKPPHYVKRCFKSRSDGSSTWSGFPCTDINSSDCCPAENPGEEDGECIATTKGGYCKSSSRNYIFRKNSSDSRPYMKRRNDEPLDINDANDMKDYFYDRGDKRKHESPEMRRFIARRTKNEKYVEDHLRGNRKVDADALVKSKNKLQDQSKNIELISTITMIHLIFLVVFSIVIRFEIIHTINGFYDLMYTQYLNFTGKNI